MIGYDLVDENIRLLREGAIDFLISQRPGRQGYLGILVLYRHVVLNETVDRTIMMPIDIITRENRRPFPGLRSSARPPAITSNRSLKEMRKRMDLRRQGVPFGTIGLALLVLFGSAVAAPPRKERLPAFFQKWLDEEVVYIIAPVERDVFLQLQTDRERDLFIEAFWKRRDPASRNPGKRVQNRT